MPIKIVASIDFDGTLTRTVGSKVEPTLSIFISKLTDIPDTIMVGSQRQSLPMDCNNSEPPKFSCFPFYNKLHELMCQTFDKSIHFDTTLLADVLTGFSATSFTTFFKNFHDVLEKKSDGEIDFYDYHRKREALLQHLSQFQPYDKNKILLLIMQMFKVAQEYSEDNIIFQFFDDDLCILIALQQYFEDGVFVPLNVTLQLKHCANIGQKDQVLFDPVKGSALIDARWKEVISLICDKCFNKEGGPIARLPIYECMKTILMGRHDANKNQLPELITKEAEAKLEVMIASSKQLPPHMMFKFSLPPPPSSKRRQAQSSSVAAPAASSSFFSQPQGTSVSAELTATSVTEGLTSAANLNK